MKAFLRSLTSIVANGFWSCVCFVMLIALFTGFPLTFLFHALHTDCGLNVASTLLWIGIPVVFLGFVVGILGPSMPPQKFASDECFTNEPTIKMPIKSVIGKLGRKM